MSDRHSKLFEMPFQPKGKEHLGNKSMECLGAMSVGFKAILQRIAEAMEHRSEISRSIWMNRLRARIVLELMKWNTKMIQASAFLFEEDDI